MIIAFGRAGNERKKLAWAIATIIGTTAEYQYMPTCTYKIGECYTVTKAGDLEISDQADRKETERLLAELENQGYTVPDTTEPESTKLRCLRTFSMNIRWVIFSRSAKTKPHSSRRLFRRIRST